MALWKCAGRFFSVLGLFCVFALGANAHVNDTSLIRVRVDPGRFSLEANLDLATLNRLTPLDANGDGFIHRNEVARAAGRLEGFLRSKLQLDFGEGPVDLGRFLEADWQSGQQSATEGDLQAVHVGFRFERALPHACKLFRLRVEFFDVLGASHSVILAVLEGQTSQQAVLTLGAPTAEYALAEENPPSAAAPGARVDSPGKGRRGLFQLGVEHILSGYDHLLFLVVLAVAVSGWRQLVWLVTAFTVAHSATVALSVLGWVRLPEKLVESAIAASIVWVAAENVWFGGGRKRWLQTFGFGLLHGMGFAGVLLALELPRAGLAWSLAAFNVGVEAGQLAVVGPVLAGVGLLGRARVGRGGVWVRRGVSGCALGIGFVWMVQRLAG